MSVSIQTVTEDEADSRLDRFLRRRFPGLTQGVLQKLCRTGQIRVDGHRVEASVRLAAGQAVRVPPMPEGAPEKSAPVTTPADTKEMERMVLHRDDQLIVLNKPSGLATQGGPASRGIWTGCWTRCARMAGIGRGWCTGWTGIRRV